ncbi:hypothetical protein BCR33DRAFT_728733, partial [Rhizoclosmatium globosum]
VAVLVSTASRKHLVAQVMSQPNSSVPLLSEKFNASAFDLLSVLERETVYLSPKNMLVAGAIVRLYIVPNGNSATPSRTAYQLLLENERERQILFPAAVYPNDDVEFSFKMFMSGTFKVTLFAEGTFKHNDLPWRLPDFKSKDYFDMPNLDKLYQFDMELKEESINSSPRLRLESHLKTLPFCTPSSMDDFQQGGRFLIATLFPTFQEGSGAGAQLIYLPPNCKLRYYSSNEATTCLQTQNITVLGDSTSAESVRDLLAHVTAQLTTKEWPESSCTLNEPCAKIREFAYESPSSSPNSPSTYITHIWGSTSHPCANGQGVIAYKDNQVFLDWTKFKISYPEFCHHFNESMAYSEKEWAVKGKWQSKPSKKQDVLVYTSGLHDLQAISGGGEYKLEDYEVWLDRVMKELAPLARTKVYVATNPTIGRHNFPNRYVNVVSRRVARKNGFLFLDQNGAFIHRLNGDGGAMVGDWVHAHPRAIFTNTNAQLYLNAMCGK